MVCTEKITVDHTHRRLHFPASTPN